MRCWSWSAHQMTRIRGRTVEKSTMRSQLTLYHVPLGKKRGVSYRTRSLPVEIESQRSRVVLGSMARQCHLWGLHSSVISPTSRSFVARETRPWMNVSEGPVQLAPAEYRAAETESGGHRGESKENNHDVLFFFFFFWNGITSVLEARFLTYRSERCRDLVSQTKKLCEAGGFGCDSSPAFSTSKSNRRVIPKLKSKHNAQPWSCSMLL